MLDYVSLSRCCHFHVWQRLPTIYAHRTGIQRTTVDRSCVNALVEERTAGCYMSFSIIAFFPLAQSEPLLSNDNAMASLVPR